MALSLKDFEYVPQKRTVQHSNGGVTPVKVDQHYAKTEKLGFNAWLAKVITKGVGNMWAFYLTALAMGIWMAGLGEAVLGDPYPWALMLLIFGGILQMLLMIAILVGQQVLGAAADSRALETYQDAAATLAECREIQKHLKAQDDSLTTLVDKLTA